MSCAKTAEAIEIPFGTDSNVGSRNMHVLDVRPRVRAFVVIISPHGMVM